MLCIKVRAGRKKIWLYHTVVVDFLFVVLQLLMRTDMQKRG